jgi:hypothetical protein
MVSAPARLFWFGRIRVQVGLRDDGEAAVRDTKPHQATMETEEKKLPVPAREGLDWTAHVADLAEDWHQRVYAAQSAHYALADRLRLMHYFVGVPAVVFASIVGTAIFTGLEKDSPRAMMVATVSILAAVLAALQTFLRLAERAAAHAAAADWYSAVRRDIEETLHLPVESRSRAKEFLDRVRKEMNRVAQDSPDLTVRVWQREAKRFGVKEPLALP